MTEEEKEEEEEEEKVAMTTIKQEGEEEVMEESEVKNEPAREEHNPPEAMIEPPRETKQPTKPLTFSTTSDLLASPQFKPGQHVLVGGAERGLVKFVGHTYFKEGLWIGVELEREKGKNDGSIDGKRYFNCSPGYGVFAPVRKVAILNEEEEEEEEVALPLSATSLVAEMMTEEEKEEEEEVAVTTMKQEGEEEVMEESEVKNEPPREEHNPPEAMIEPPRETKQPTEPLTFSTTSDLLASLQFKPGQHVLVGGAERGLVKFVGHTYFKEGLWIGVELEREKGKNDGSIDGKRYFNCSPGYGVFAPVRKVAILNEEEEEEEEVALPLSATSLVAEMMTEEEKEEEEKVAVTTMKQEGEEEVMEESEVKNEPPREEHNPPEAMIEPPRETKQPTEPLTFSTTSDLLASPQFKPGQHVLVGGAERGLVKFVGHTHFKEGLWIGVELEREKGKNDGSIDGKRYFNCSPGYGVFAPVRKVAILNEEEEEEEEVAPKVTPGLTSHLRKTRTRRRRKEGRERYKREWRERRGGWKEGRERENRILMKLS